jgi:N-acetyl-anhydromuramyl-L-alanine amidase AmpD
MSILDTIVQLPLPEDCYVNTVYEKKFIVLHHTASSGNPFSVVEYWKSRHNKVSTPFLIARGKGAKYSDGQIFQCFPSNRGCWHLGVAQKDLDRGKPGNKTSTFLNMNSCGIELCAYGGLTFKKGKYLTYDGTAIPKADVYEFETPFRGFKFYHAYSAAQIESLKQLMQYLGEKYNISLKYPGDQIWDVCPEAIRGNLSITAHTSFRTADAKQDACPQKPLVDMLKSL